MNFEWNIYQCIDNQSSKYDSPEIGRAHVW
jgi:hypothetical protein